MRFHWPAIVLFLTLSNPSISIPSQQKAPPTLDQIGNRIYEIVSPSVIKILQIDAGNKIIAEATGFSFEDSKIITNYHVVQGGNLRAKIGPLTIDLLVKFTDPANDVAILEVVGKATLPYLKSTSTPSKPGDRVFVIGNPIGLEKTISEGIVSAVRDIKGRTLIQITAAISPGSSGSPVVDTEGRVLAIAVGSIEEGQSLNFAVPIEYAVRLLKPTAMSLKVSLEEQVSYLEDIERSPDSYARWDEVTSLARDLADRVMTDPKLSVRLTKVLLGRDNEKAIQIADAVLTDGKGPIIDAGMIKIDALLWESKEKTWSDKQAEADNLLARADQAVLKLFAVVPKPPARIYLLQGKIRHEQNKNPEAELLFRQAIRLSQPEKDQETLEESCRLLIETLDDLGMVKEAAAQFETDPHPAWTSYDWSAQARRLEALNRYTEAATAWENALPGSTNYRIWIMAGDSNYIAGNLDKALAYLRKGLDLGATKNNANSDLAWANRDISDILEARGLLDQALIHAKQAVILDPNNIVYPKNWTGD